MANPTPIAKKAIVKKRTATFKRFASDMFMRVKQSWRKPRGIDNRRRRRYRGNAPMASVGFGSDAKTRHLLPNGFKKFRVFNLKDVDMLTMLNRTYAAEIASTVSAANRKAIVQRCEQLNIRCINAGAKLVAEESE